MNKNDLVRKTFSPIFREKGWDVADRHKFSGGQVRVFYKSVYELDDIERSIALSRHLKRAGFQNELRFKDYFIFGPHMEIWVSESYLYNKLER